MAIEVNGATKQEVGELYAAKYRKAAGDPIFSQYDGTPLSHAATERLLLLDGPLYGVDMGAGTGVHAIDLAANIPNLHLTAVDINKRPLFAMRARLAVDSVRAVVGGRVVPHLGEVDEWFRNQKPGSLDFVYGSSYGHFLPDQEEMETLHLAREAVKRGALIAISQKDINCDLLKDVVEESPLQEPGWVLATPRIDGITRRFLRSSAVLASRLERAGFTEVLWQDGWKVKDYDKPETTASFVGVLARAG